MLETGVEAKNGLMGEGTVNSQHGTGVEGSLHPCVYTVPKAVWKIF